MTRLVPVLAALVVALPSGTAARAEPLAVEHALRHKPVLSVILSVPGREAAMAEELALTRAEAEQLRAIADRERWSMAALRDGGVAAADWNAAVADQAAATDAALRTLLGDRHPAMLAQLQAWFDADAARGGPGPRDEVCLSYTVYATQFDALTPYEVALPDAYVKFANLDWEHHAGYEGSNYEVQLQRESHDITVWVGDAGPWNIDDNYWNDLTGPRPRRMFTDLPQGKPEAEAAYYDGYNGGLDQYGRTVTVPCAIDLAFDVATDLGLAYLENDWITVTYLWECDEVGDDDTAGDDDTSADDDTGDDDTAADDDGDDDGTEDEGSAPKVGDRVGGCSCRLPGSA